MAKESTAPPTAPSERLPLHHWVHNHILYSSVVLMLHLRHTGVPVHHQTSPKNHWNTASNTGKWIISAWLTMYPNSIVEILAWIMDHRPQKKWEARANLQMGTHEWELEIIREINAVQEGELLQPPSVNQIRHPACTRYRMNWKEKSKCRWTRSSRFSSPKESSWIIPVCLDNHLFHLGLVFTYSTFTLRQVVSEEVQLKSEPERAW